MKKVTVIGGGTGTFVVLSGMKKYPLDLGVVVSMMDSGGSTGKLRDQLGVLPPGDLRQCLVALSEAPLFWRRLFLYRFESGDLAGHNFGNIFLSALEKVLPSYRQVVKAASFVLKTKGEVIPATFSKANLCVEYANGKIVKGEGKIDKNYQEKSRIVRAFLEPVSPQSESFVEAASWAIRRLLSSNYIIIGPGDLYTSIIPVALVGKIKETIKKTKGKLIYILNLMTKAGQTTDYKASDHLKDIEFYFGKIPDFVIINNGKIPRGILKWYYSWHERPVENDLDSANYKGKIILADIVDREKIKKDKSDIFIDPRVRSILRHHPGKIAQVLKKIILG